MPAAEQFVIKMQEELKRAKQCMLDAQTRMKSTADKFRKDITFKVNDDVLLATKNLKLKGNNPRKLLPRFIGAFKVLKCVGKVSYKLGLPDHMRIHDVFHVSLLHPYKSDGQRHMPPPELVDGEYEFTVQSITAHRVSVVGGKRLRARRTKVEYLVSWEGYGREHDTWEPSSVVEDTNALDIYLRSLLKSKKELPPGAYPDSDTVAPRKRGRSTSPSIADVAVPASGRKRVRFNL